MGTRICKGFPVLRRFDKKGQLDTSFGEQGVVTLTQQKGDYGVGIGSHQSESFIIAPDDSIYVLMDKRDAENHTNFQVLHVTKNGAIDTAYGEMGRVTLGNKAYYNQIAISKNGGVYVAGHQGNTILFTKVNPSTENPPESISYTPAEKLTGFGPFAAGSDLIGNLYYFGNGIFKLNEKGIPDSQFGNEGYIPPPPGLSPNAPYLTTFEDGAVMKDGRIVALGRYLSSSPSGGYPAGALIRYLPNGAMDKSFGLSGVVFVLAPENKQDNLHSLTVDEEGNVYTASFHPSRGNFSVRKFDNEGELVPAFGENGWLKLLFQGFQPTVARLQLDEEGKLLVSGHLSGGGSMLSRHLPETGALDPEFNGGKPVTSLCR